MIAYHKELQLGNSTLAALHCTQTTNLHTYPHQCTQKSVQEFSFLEEAGMTLLEQANRVALGVQLRLPLWRLHVLEA